MHPTRIFKTANDLLLAWNEYKCHVDSEAHKWAKIQYVGKDGNRVEDYPRMPYVLDGFIAWYFNVYGKHIHQYFKRVEEYEDEFLPIVTHIIAERNSNVVTGTLLGNFNSSMGNRIVGLADKTESNIQVNQSILNLDPLDDSKDNIITKDSEPKKED